MALGKQAAVANGEGEGAGEGLGVVGAEGGVAGDSGVLCGKRRGR